MENRGLKKPEVCEMLGISIGTLNKMLAKRQIKSIRIGERGVRIALAEVDRLLNGAK